MAKSKKTIIYENLDKIKELKKMGVTDEAICKEIGIGRSTWYNHVSKNKDIQDALKDSTQKFIIDLRNELVRKAMKHTLETKETSITKDAKGKDVKFTKITVREVDGDTGAIHLLLKNLDKENWKNDWDNYDFKKQELELRKLMVENNLF